MADKKATTTSLGLVNRILSFLKLGEDGKIMSFFDGEVKRLRTTVTGLERKIGNLTYNHEGTLDELNDQIEDTQEALEQAYFNITPEQVATNGMQKSFSYSYWESIESYENALAALKNEAEEAVTSYEKQVAKYRKQQEVINARIDKIVAA